MAKPYQPKDRYYQRAKAAGLRARSAFKIEEIAKRLKVVRAGIAVLDLGAAPGGWLQILATLAGPRGLVIGVDRVAIAPLGLPQVKTLLADVTTPDFARRLAEITSRKLDLVTSDMAPKTCGIRSADQARSLELCEIALSCAARHLRPGGAFITKVFMGGDFKRFETAARARFEDVRSMRPDATREGSFEIYLTCRGFRS